MAELDEKKDREEYDKTFTILSDKEGKEDEIESVSNTMQYFSPVASGLRTIFTDTEGLRSQIEERWEKDLRQYKAEYDPEVKSKIHPKRSKAFFSITKTKVKTISSRQSDLLFPANGDKNWGIETSPIPDLDAAIIQSISEQYTQQTGQQLTEDDIRALINKEATDRCKKMEKEMQDQLSELNYREIIRNVIKSGNIYGTGILKGPLVKIKKSQRYLPNGDGWVKVELQKMLPYLEFVPVWDIYPDMSVTDVEEARFIFQRHVMGKQKLFQLAKRDDFKGKEILEYMKAYPEGDYTVRNFENNLRNMSSEGRDSTVTDVDGKQVAAGAFPQAKSFKYDVLEYWGYITGDQVKDLEELELPDDYEDGQELAANIWLLGDMIIKAVVSPIEGVNFPYHMYYYEKDETSIFGEGIPTIMRDSQMMFNASIRAMLDNAAISSGPIIEANMDLLSPNENPRDLYPFRVFERGGMGSEGSNAALRVYEIPSYTQHLLTMVQFFQASADEITTIPRYTYGDNSNLGSGAGRTASGLSMLMGAANVTLKDQVKNFDDGITKRFIKALYQWNMEFNPKEELKGDFEVVAKGSGSLIAKEILLENLNMFLSITNNPVDLMYTNRDEVLRIWIETMDLSKYHFIKDKDVVRKETEVRNQAAAEEMQFMRQLAMIKATSGGHMQQPQQQPQGVAQMLQQPQQGQPQ